jgi:hypothetical protein
MLGRYDDLQRDEQIISRLALETISIFTDLLPQTDEIAGSPLV